jgi:hypothetical protein
VPAPRPFRCTGKRTYFKPGKTMTREPSIKEIANTRDNPIINPYVADVLKTITHIGPTASCKSIPN